MTDFRSQISKISSRQDFINFLGNLSEDFQKEPASWENNTLATYLEAMQSWTEDMDGHYLNTGQTLPENIDWQVFASILAAATIYE